MVSRTTVIAIALLAFVGGVTTGGVTAAVASGNPFTEPPDATLRSFETVAVGCVDPTEPGAVTRTVSAPNGSGQDLSLQENTTVPSPDASLDAHFERIAPGTYLLDVQTVLGDGEATCGEGRPEARFHANLTVPNDYTLVLLRDGEYVGVNRASSGPNGGSAGAGRRESGGDSAAGSSGSSAGNANSGADDGSTANGTAESES